MVNMNGDAKTSNSRKVEIKPELASPVQSSSDSGVADVTSDNNEQDITCWECGCEFANLSSLRTHAELYHRDDLRGSNAKKSISDHLSANRTKKFSCAICNFNSDKQRTIIEHMRFHTGEVLPCRAGPPCAFTTVCDSTLEKHVETEHNDGLKRCPHCAFHCSDKVSFIRHYRKCHHSKSCMRCKEIKHTLDFKSKIPEDLMSKNGDHQDNSDVVRPYLHHNPYSKRASAITPYAHCNAAMSKVAVAIPQYLQTSAEEIVTLQQAEQREHKSRKQSMPRKLLQTNAALQTSELSIQPKRNFCDINRNFRQKNKRSLSARYRKKLLKFPKVPFRRCRLSHPQPFVFRRDANFIRHMFWWHYARKYSCQKCDMKFSYLYQVLIHRRKEHEKFVQDGNFS